MSDVDNPAQRAATAKVQARRGISIVWIVPLVALLIGGWLAFKAYREKGPVISISFVSAEGLEAGKTKVRYKDVVIGEVVSIRLGEDLKGVVVTAAMSRDAEKLLNDQTRFWIVRAQIRGGTVSGLGTVFSGAYIGIDPGSGGAAATSFTGLEIPPVVTTGLPGRHYWLRAERLGSLSIGAPVYYRQIPVGQVVSYGFAPDSQAVDIQLFVSAPHHLKVTENTRFWNASGIDLSLNAQGVTLNTESLVSVVGGGIAFAVPHGVLEGEPAPADTRFRLYTDRASIQEKSYSVRRYWLLYFDQSVRGLSVGAPVELHGIKIGEVVNLELEFNPASQDFRVPVVVAIEPERIRGINGQLAQQPASGAEPLVRQLVEQRGLRGQLKNGNLLTGQRFIDLDFEPGATQRRLSYAEGYPVIPTIPAPLEQLQESLARIVDRLDRVPFEQIGEELRQTLKESNLTLKKSGEFAERLNQETLPQLSATLGELHDTLQELQKTVGRDSPLHYHARKTLEELSLTLRSLRELSENLERQPQSLLFGKEKNSDDD